MITRFSLATLAVLFAASILWAEEPGHFKVRGPVAAPIGYHDGAMLVLVNSEGVAAVTFTKQIAEGVKYQYRYLPKEGEEKSGEGEVFEKYERVSIPNKPHDKRVIDKGGKLHIEAGSLKVTWSLGSPKSGYIYYFPEEVCVQIAEAKDYKSLDLSRYLHLCSALKTVSRP